MSAINLIKEACKQIHQLRRNRLSQGHTFIINSDSLPSGQCYLEFPDGSIVIVEANSEKTDFNIIEELDGFEIKKLRKHFKLT